MALKKQPLSHAISCSHQPKSKYLTAGIVGWMVAPKRIYPCPNPWLLPRLKKKVLQMSLRILRWDFHPILSGWVLNRMTIVLIIQEGQRDIWDRQKRRYRHRKGVMWRQRQKLSDVASSQGSWPPAEAERGRDRISPRASVGRAALLTPWCHTSGLYNCEIVNFYCVKPPSWLVSQQARRTLIQHALNLF